MKIGDMVVRAYAFGDGLVSGIIVDEELDIITATNEEYSYEQCEFVVQWSDGTQSRELYEELDEYEFVLKNTLMYNRSEEAQLETSSK